MDAARGRHKTRQLILARASRLHVPRARRRLSIRVILSQLFFTEAITDMALRQDINGVSRVVFNFLSQLIDDNA
jgi:hypothetical protein